MTTDMQSTGPQAIPALRMVRGEVQGQELQRWMGSRRLRDIDHAMHCLLVESFGSLAPKPFRLIMNRDGLKGIFYGYGTADCEFLRESAAICADPLQTRILPPESLQDKTMPTSWTSDKRLGFEVRIRPVVRKGRNSGRHRDEQDAFQHMAEQYEKGKIPLTREEVYVQWLAELMAREGAAQVDDRETKLIFFQRLRSFRKQDPRYVEGPDAVLRGALTVGDPEAFASLLARGIGRHRSYGYGMLLLRPSSG